MKHLKEKGLAEEKNSTPKVFSAKSPRTVINDWISEREREMQEETTAMLGVLQILQKIWINQHETQLGTNLFLLSEHFVREVIPQEIQTVTENICLAIRTPDISPPLSKGSVSAFFDHALLTKAMKKFATHGAVLHLLIGNLESFLERSWAEGVSILLRGIDEGFIEVRETKQQVPHTFLIVDNRRVYLFFLDCTGYTHREAIRTEIPGLVDTFNLFWNMLWEHATVVSPEHILSLSKMQKKQ